MVELTRIELVSESRSLRISTGVVCYLGFRLFPQIPQADTQYSLVA